MKKVPFTLKRDRLYRADGRIERVCEHGVGHTISIRNVRYVDWTDPRSIEVWWSHGCDGCCADFEKEDWPRDE